MIRNRHLKQWALLLTVVWLGTGYQSGPEDRLFSTYLNKTLTIDGDLSDWPSIDAVTVHDRVIRQGDHERILSDNEMSCYSAWNQDHLFFAFLVKDQNLQAFQKERDHERLFLDDMVEVLLDPLLDRTGQWLQDDLVYHINLLGQVKDDRGTPEGKPDQAWNGTAQFALVVNGTVNQATDKDKGFSVEIAIPWREIARKPINGLKMGFNFANGDNDGLGRQLFDWRGTWPMRNPRQFGILELTGH